MRSAARASGAVVSMLVLGLFGSPGHADEPAAAAPVVVYDATSGPESPVGTLPKGQGVEASAAEVGGHPAAALAVTGDVAWARIWFRTVPADVRPFARLAIEARNFGAPSASVSIRLTDAAEKEALLRVDGWKAEWETRRLDLGDFQPEPGFDPRAVETLSLVWMKPKAATAALAKVTFVPGPSGWRHPPEEQVRRIFGEKRAPSVKRETTAHFDVFSDNAKALKSLGAALEADAKAIAFLLDVAEADLKDWRLPVYAFKASGDYTEYCVRVLGWTEEEARRTPVTGSARAVVLHTQGGTSPERARRVARAMFEHVYGDGGGAWLQDGCGEYCLRKVADQPVTKEFAPRAKTGEHWSLAELIRAAKLHAPTDQKDASYDYRPVYLHAACVFEYLATEPPEGATDAREGIRARFQALAAIRSTGAERLAEVEKALGRSAPEVEAAWKKWATARR